MTEAEPRWDRDLEYGRQAELRVGEILEWIAQRNGRVEFKRKRRLDLQLYIETHCDKGRTGTYQKSGINMTEADFYAYVFGDSEICLWLPVPLLREAIQHRTARLVEEKDGSCPTKGILVNVAAILATAAPESKRQGADQLGLL